MPCLLLPPHARKADSNAPERIEMASQTTSAARPDVTRLVGVLRSLSDWTTSSEQEHLGRVSQDVRREVAAINARLHQEVASINGRLDRIEQLLSRAIESKVIAAPDSPVEERKPNRRPREEDEEEQDGQGHGEPSSPRPCQRRRIEESQASTSTSAAPLLSTSSSVLAQTVLPSAAAAAPAVPSPSIKEAARPVPKAVPAPPDLRLVGCAWPSRLPPNSTAADRIEREGMRHFPPASLHAILGAMGLRCGDHDARQRSCIYGWLPDFPRLKNEFAAPWEGYLTMWIGPVPAGWGIRAPCHEWRSCACYLGGEQSRYNRARSIWHAYEWAQPKDEQAGLAKRLADAGKGSALRRLCDQRFYAKHRFAKEAKSLPEIKSALNVHFT